MVPGNESRNEFPSSEPAHWGPKTSAGSEDVITLTKSQLQKLLRALEAQDSSDTISTTAVPTITSALNKLPISGDDCLPNWVRRSSTAARGVEQPIEPTLTGFPQRLSNSHPDLGRAPSRPFSKLAQKQLQWERERAEMQDWNPWGRPGGGAPRCQPVAAVPPRTDAQVLRVQAVTAASSTGAYPSRLPSPPSLPQLPLNGRSMSPTLVRRVPPYLRSQLPFGPSYDVQQDEKEEAKRRWLQELDCQREESQRRHLANLHASLSNGSCWADSESLGSEKATRPGEDCSDSVWSVSRGQGGQPSLSSKMSASDEKRIKALEYQRAIQAQMQEKQQRLRAEREARIREEREQERRLEEDRLKLELEYQEEQRRLREKKEHEEKTRLLLIAKMQQAAAEAEALRKAKRSQKLQQMSPSVQQGSSFDTTGSVDADFSTSLDRISSSTAGISNIGSEDQTDMSTQQNTSSAGMPSQAVPPPASQPQARSTYALAMPAATVRPSLRGGDSDGVASNKAQREVCCQTDGSLSASVCSSRCSLLSSAGMVELNPYVENRVLTPTKVRIAQHALLRSRQQHCREFGIQTDISLPCGWNHSILCEDRVRLTQDFENRSSLREFPPYTSAVRRLQHSLPLRGVHRNASSYTPCENVRDATWQTPMAATKGMVADAFPATIARSSAQRLQELRRQHCERESGARRLRAVSQFSSQVGRGGIVERNRGRAPVRATGQVPIRFEEEAAHNTTQSEEEDSTIHDSSAHRPIQSPPVPALRDKIILPSPRSDHSVSNAANSSSEAVTTPGKCHETPPASRKRWRRQEVYVPQHPIGETSPKQSSPNRGKVESTPLRDHQPLGIVERQRSVSVSGARRSQSPSPDRRPQRSSSQDPLVHPELVTSCPTRRQDKILQQLFTLRQGLLIKQREMETHLVKVKP